MGNNYTGDRNEVSGLQALNFLNVYWLAIICTYSSKLQSLQVNSLSISFSDGIVARRYYWTIAPQKATITIGMFCSFGAFT